MGLSGVKVLNGVGDGVGGVRVLRVWGLSLSLSGEGLVPAPGSKAAVDINKSSCLLCKWHARCLVPGETGEGTDSPGLFCFLPAGPVRPSADGAAPVKLEEPVFSPKTAFYYLVTTICKGWRNYFIIYIFYKRSPCSLC